LIVELLLGEGSFKSSTLEFKPPSLKRKNSLSDAELNMLSTFKPVTLTVSSFFKQVHLMQVFIQNLLDFIKLPRSELVK